MYSIALPLGHSSQTEIDPLSSYSRCIYQKSEILNIPQLSPIVPFSKARFTAMSGVDYLIQHMGQQNHQEGNKFDTGSPENHRPYVPKYSTKDEGILRRVDLTSLESINAVFFPEAYAQGQDSWVEVPNHILGIDTDFAFVTKKIDEFRRWNPAAQKRELARWDNMQRWERNMYEDRIAILMQQKTLMTSSAAQLQQPSAGVLMNRVTGHKRNREFQMAAMTPAKNVVSEVLSGGSAVPDSPGTVAMLLTASNRVVNYSEIPDSKHRCLRMKPPIPSRYQG